MLNLLRRLCFEFSSASRAVSTAVGSMEEQLFSCLFQGQGRYSPAKAAQLAGKLREVADSLDKQSQQQENEVKEPGSKRRRKEARGRGQDLDFSAYQQRYVALELLYLGHAYDGFARQDHTPETIEGHLFSALHKTRLVPPAASWQELRYSRGGRTDKGVSALGQVVALLLRSSARPGQPVPAVAQELDYPTLLNRVLPPDIRILGWADAPEDFSARFSARYREYKYLILHNPPALPTLPAPLAGPAAAAEVAVAGGVGVTAAAAAAAAGAAAAAEAGGRGGSSSGVVGGAPDQQQQGGQQQQQGLRGADVASCGPVLDVGRMQQAAAFFLGEHDFRNFCKVDVSQVQNFRRHILDFRVEEVEGFELGGRRLLQLYIRGTAFLWHQVRCMAAVLLMVGQGQEEPGIVAQLLDVQRTPCKPQYRMASEEPLLLYSCTYGADLRFHRTAANYAAVQAGLEASLASHTIRAGLLHTVRQKLGADEVTAGKRRYPGGTPGPAAQHVPLLLREKELALEERIMRLKPGGRAATAAAAAVAARAQAQAQAVGGQQGEGMAGVAPPAAAAAAAHEGAEAMELR